MPHERTVAIGIWVTSFAVGGAIGPLVGGVLLEHYWWGSVFLVGVPVMALLLVIGPWLLPEYRDDKGGPARPAQRGALARRGAGGDLWTQAHRGSGRRRAAARGDGSGRRDRLRLRPAPGELADPLIDLRLFRAPAFSAALVINTLGFFVGFAAFLLIAQYLQLVLGLSPLKAGLWSLAVEPGLHRGLATAWRAWCARMRPGFVVAGGPGARRRRLRAAGRAGPGQRLADARRRLCDPVARAVLRRSPWRSTCWWEPRRRSAPARRRRCPRPARNSAARSASRSWAAWSSRVYRHALSEASLDGVPPAAARGRAFQPGCGSGRGGRAGRTGGRSLMEASGARPSRRPSRSRLLISAAVALADRIAGGDHAAARKGGFPGGRRLRA